MVDCSCYHDEKNFLGKRGVCWGTKEREACSCGGDAAKCDFYPEKKSTAKRITLDASKFKAFSVDKTPGIEYDNIRFAKSFIQEAYSWHNDIMEITRRIVHETDEARLSNIADHFEVDLSEIREFINKKQREKLGKKTHFDEIREMDVEELAWELARICRMPFYKDDSEIDGYEVDCWAKWLKQEANE